MIISDNRCQDRRQGIPFFCPYHLGIKPGRRMTERRAAENGEPRYVDRYPLHLMLCTVAILLLSVLDACLTLNILAGGGKEVNWFMAILIEDSVEKFIVIKLLLTGLALILLVVHHKVKLTGKICVWHLKYLILSGYGALIGYELVLLSVMAR